MMIERAASASLFALLVAACSSSAVPSSVEGSVDPNKAPASAGNPSSNAPTAPTPEALSRSSCFIDGFFYSRGDSNPLDACAACLPLYGDQHWTALPHGSACGNHGVCTAGVCVQPPHGPGGPGPGPGAADCIIGSTPYAIGAENPANACQVCAPFASTTAWTNALAGKSCPGGTCNAGTCDVTVAIPTCTIAGVGYETNETNPTNAV